MSPDRSDRSGDLCEYLPWDTRHFGVRIGRVKARHLDSASAAAILNWCEEQEIDCLYFLADLEDMETVRCAEDHHFRMVDIRVTLERRIPEGGIALIGPSREVCIRMAAPSDLPALRSIAGDGYSFTRFWSDPCFSRQACQALYEIWIEKSVMGEAQAVLVAVGSGKESQVHQPIGFITCLIEEKHQGRIGLVGVDQAHQGNGIGQRLTESALNWFWEQGVGRVAVTTQGRNASAQRMYQRCGFFSQTVQLWYHRWFSNCDHGYADPES